MVLGIVKPIQKYAKVFKKAIKSGASLFEYGADVIVTDNIDLISAF